MTQTHTDAMDLNRNETCPQTGVSSEITNRDDAQNWEIPYSSWSGNHSMLLPVVNPNLRTIEPREMWDKYGIEALITNSM